MDVAKTKGTLFPFVPFSRNKRKKGSHPWNQASSDYAGEEEDHGDDQQKKEQVAQRKEKRIHSAQRWNRWTFFKEKHGFPSFPYRHVVIPIEYLELSFKKDILTQREMC
jgi:hypothetical protein